MRVNIGTKSTITLPDGRMYPARVVAEPEAMPFTLRDGTEITVVRADTISLRTTRDGVPFLAYSNETVTFGFRNVMKPRLSSIVGLDATEDGEVIDLQTLLDLQGADESKHVAGLFEARQNPGTTSAADL